MSEPKIDWEEESPQERSTVLGNNNLHRRPLVVAEMFPETLPPSQQTRSVNGKEQDHETEYNPNSFDCLVHKLIPQPLPDFFVLGHCTISMNTIPFPLFLHRLCSFIKKCSLEFHTVPESGRIDCRASGQLSFCVLVWKNREGGIVVELQRRQGCGVLMHRYRAALTRYLQSGLDFNPDTINQCSYVMPQVQRLVTMQMPSASSDTITQCRSTLECQFGDQKQLALENILLLLNSRSVDFSTKEKLAEHVLLGIQNKECQTTMLGQLPYLLLRNQRRTFSRSESYHYEKKVFSDGHACGLLSELALQILASSLFVAVQSRRGGMSQTSRRFDVFAEPWENIIGALCSNICHTASHPLEVGLSARCLSLLDILTNQDVVRMILNSSCDVLPSLFAAHKYGAKHNDILRRATQDLLNRVEDVL